METRHRWLLTNEYSLNFVYIYARTLSQALEIIHKSSHMQTYVFKYTCARIYVYIVYKLLQLIWLPLIDILTYLIGWCPYRIDAWLYIIGKCPSLYWWMSLYHWYDSILLKYSHVIFIIKANESKEAGREGWIVWWISRWNVSGCRWILLKCSIVKKRNHRQPLKCIVQI